MKTLLAVIASAALLGGCAVAPVDSYSYAPYYDSGPYYAPYYTPGYYGPDYYYYSPPVIVGGVRYYSHDRHDWRDRHDWHGNRNWHGSAWRGGQRSTERSRQRSVRPTTSAAPRSQHWTGRPAAASVNRTTRPIAAPAQRAMRPAPATSRAHAGDMARRNS